MEERFEGEIIAVTGDSPFPSDAIERIVELEGATLGGTFNRDDTWQENQLVIIGREDFSKEYLIESVEVGQRHGFICQYITQEDFLWYWLENTEPKPYIKNDPRIEKHEGLKF